MPTVSKDNYAEIVPSDDGVQFLKTFLLTTVFKLNSKGFHHFNDLLTFGERIY